MAARTRYVSQGALRSVWLGVLSADESSTSSRRARSAQLSPAGRRRHVHRGFGPGELGDGRPAAHRWEASLELRVPRPRTSTRRVRRHGRRERGFEIVRTYDPTRVGSAFESRSCSERKSFRFDHLTPQSAAVCVLHRDRSDPLDVGVRPGPGRASRRRLPHGLGSPGSRCSPTDHWRRILSSPTSVKLAGSHVGGGHDRGLSIALVACVLA